MHSLPEAAVALTRLGREQSATDKSSGVEGAQTARTLGLPLTAGSPHPRSAHPPSEGGADPLLLDKFSPHLGGAVSSRGAQGFFEPKKAPELVLEAAPTPFS